MKADYGKVYNHQLNQLKQIEEDIELNSLANNSLLYLKGNKNQHLILNTQTYTNPKYRNCFSNKLFYKKILAKTRIQIFHYPT